MAFCQMDIVPHTNTDKAVNMKTDKKTLRFDRDNIIVFLIFLLCLALAILVYVQDVPNNTPGHFFRLLGVWIFGTLAFCAFVAMLMRHGVRNWNAYQRWLREQRDAALGDMQNPGGSREAPPANPPNDPG